VNLRRVGALTRRIVEGMRRDHRSMALIVVVPIVVIGLLAWVIREQETIDVRLAVVNEAGAAAQPLADAIGDEAVAADMELVTPAAETRDGVVDCLEAETCDAGVVIPSDYATQIAADASPTIEIVTLGVAAGTEGSTAERVARVVASAFTSFLPPGVPVPSVEASTVYGTADGDVVTSFAPVFVAYFGYFFVFILTGVSFLRERLGGTLERLLATPISRAEIVSGYNTGFGIFAALQVALLLTFTLMSVQVPAIGPLPSFSIGLGVPTAGSPVLAFTIALLLALGAVSLGIFLSTFARTELQVIQFIPLVIVPQGLLGGIFWPVDALPPILQPIAMLLPVTHAVDALRSVMIAGADLAIRTVQVDMLYLVLVAAFFVVLASRTIRREVA